MAECKISWKRSAGVIIAIKDKVDANSAFDYKILTMERTSESSHFPGATVFPGGVLDKADTSQEWLKLYNDFGFTIDAFNAFKPKENRLRIFEQVDHDEIPIYLSLRITAIREVFEETGILMCRSSNIRKEKQLPWANFVLRDDLVEWQNKVCNNAYEFLNLCKQFNVYPDIWSLHEWSNWATPLGDSSNYDLILFLAAFQEIPYTNINSKEATQLSRYTPEEHIELFKEKKLLLLPPQFYELSRLKLLSSIDVLVKFAQERASYGAELCASRRILGSDFHCVLLPGDELYSSAIDLQKNAPVNLDSIMGSRIQHRIYVHSLYEQRIVIRNYTPPFPNLEYHI